MNAERAYTQCYMILQVEWGWGAGDYTAEPCLSFKYEARMFYMVYVQTYPEVFVTF